MRKNRRPLREIRADIRDAIHRKKMYLKNTEEIKTNPQVRESRLRAEGEIGALRGVLDALDGDNVILNIMAGK